jgi:4-carboxymuconolactone decarboxylase
MTVALGRWEEFDVHVRAALEHGVSADTLKEVLIQAAVYCGVPAANTAFHRAQAILSARSAG